MKRLLVKLKGLRHRLKDPSPQAPIPNEGVVDSEQTTPKTVRLKQKQKGNVIQQNAPLELLPPEVRHCLLSVLPLRELSNLIHASPVFFQQYLLARKTLIVESLQQTLRSVTVDACAAFRYDSPELAFRSRSMVADYLKPYQSKRTALCYSIDMEKLTEEEAFKMAKFHASVMQPLMRVYAEWTLADLSHQAGSGQTNHKPLSRTEETRLMRAMYRFQLMCNLFGSGKYYRAATRRLDFGSIDIHLLFFDLYEPWEIEEITCFHLFASEKYEQIFKQISWDVNENNPKFDGLRPPTPEGAFHLHLGWFSDMLLKGTMTRGLELLHTVFFSIKNHEHLVTTMQQQMVYLSSDFLDIFVLNDTSIWSRRRDHPSERDEREARRDPLPFLGDQEPLGLIDLTHPPLAWTLVWGGTYSNVIGVYIEDDVRRWGYVFWDAARLEEMRGKEVLARQWEARWGDDDARDQV
ncbi:hypothetical protein PT974_11213 [Cladobotryum mycophilum]|uniref:F-box domain-containing protein n=1 Tax=Cladobotryum mycophilum TaxID=491253 RepID=A0ABR0S5L0_9HYPO